ncbi:hypothetical protein [Methylocapsa sp. S129]|uniref:hypothetical protein n=1 Tax=Methylocapsa sp. S129 TaxID=1641869 RepID=UPI00131AE07B|nr:hypothetical protein [Methylocapsa sp. S129]
MKALPDMPSPQKTLLWAAAMAGLTLVPALAEAQSSLCARDERVIFSCRLTESRKIVSLCSSRDLSPSSGYMQYRFGKANAVELAYPPTKIPPKGHIDLVHTQYIRSGAYGVSFYIGTMHYALEYVATGPDSNDDFYQLAAETPKAENTTFRDTCDKPSIQGKDAFYPLEQLSKATGIGVLEKEDDQ